MKNILFILSLIAAFFFTPNAQAQVSSGGNMMIAENGDLFIIGKHSFEKGSGFITPGSITTSRTGAKGYVNFGEGSSWVGAAEGRFVNGYVSVTHEQPFVFPIGNANKYRPVASSGASNMTAAYFGTGVSKAYMNKENNLNRVSDKEYWDVSGDTPITLSFVWGAESNIANMTKRRTERLTLVGWKNNRWEVIPSTITTDPSNLQANLSAAITTEDFSKGIISTNKVIVPDAYKYFTLGALEEGNKRALPLQSELVSVYPNPVAKDVYVNIEELELGSKGEIKIYDIDGTEMEARKIDKQSSSVQHFDASNYVNGIYRLNIQIEDKQITQKFVVGRAY